MSKRIFFKYKEAFMGLPVLKQAPFDFLYYPVLFFLPLYLYKSYVASPKNEYYDIYDSKIIVENLKK